MRLSIRATAREIGVSHVAVCKWLRRGLISLGPDRKLDPDEVRAQRKISTEAVITAAEVEITRRFKNLFESNQIAARALVTKLAAVVNLDASKEGDS